jgi:hypothetical protein
MQFKAHQIQIQILGEFSLDEGKWKLEGYHNYMYYIQLLECNIIELLQKRQVIMDKLFAMASKGAIWS